MSTPRQVRRGLLGLCSALFRWTYPQLQCLCLAAPCRHSRPALRRKVFLRGQEAERLTEREKGGRRRDIDRKLHR